MNLGSQPFSIYEAMMKQVFTNDLSNKGSSTREIEIKLSVLQDALNSLSEAVSVLQSMKAVETNLLFQDIESNFPKKGISFQKVVKQYQVSLIRQALVASSGSQTRAAKLLNVNVSTLNAIIKRLDINFK